jgi:hypothetical protein
MIKHALDLTGGSDPNPFRALFGKPRNLLWPVLVHRITIPAVDRDYRELNTFEVLILRLLEECGPLTSERLVDETSLPFGLVKGITDKLYDKGRIDPYNEVIQSEVSSTYTSHYQSLDFTTAVLFQDKIGGEVFPVIKFMDKTSVLKQREIKDSKSIRHKGQREMPAITPSTVRSLAIILNRRSLGQEKRIQIKDDTDIKFVGKPEDFMLNCPIAHETKGANFRIACPFGNGYSVPLEKQYRKLLQVNQNLLEWHNKWETSLLSLVKTSPGIKIHGPFKGDSDWQSYPELKAALQSSDAHLSTKDLYGALEWALFYSCTEQNYRVQVRKIRSYAGQKQIALIEEASSKLGFEMPNGLFRPISTSRIRSFDEGEAEMMTVLSLSILIAQNNPGKGLAKLATEHPDYFQKIKELKESRDSIRHGSTQDSKSRATHEMMFLESIATLLSRIELTQSESKKQYSDIETDLLLRARMTIQNHLGMATYNKLPEEQQDQFAMIEKHRANPEQHTEDKDSTDKVEAGRFLGGLCTLFQALLKSKIMNIKNPPFPESDPLSEAQALSAKYNLGKVPPGVSLHRIQHTIMNINDDTLNSCIICFLLTASEETLRALSITQPGFFDLLRKLNKYVGHGNRAIPLSADEMENIARESYSAAKDFLEA